MYWRWKTVSQWQTSTEKSKNFVGIITDWKRRRVKVMGKEEIKNGKESYEKKKKKKKQPWYFYDD